MLRWEVLHAEVLARVFPNDNNIYYNDDNESVRVIGHRQQIKCDDDAEDRLLELFLANVRAFGFVEVTSGLDRGSFYHQVRNGDALV